MNYAILSESEVKAKHNKGHAYQIHMITYKKKI